MTEEEAHAAAVQALRDSMLQADDNTLLEYNSEYESSHGNSMVCESNGGNSSTRHADDFYNSEELRAIQTTHGFDSSQVELLNELMEYQQQSASMQPPDDATAHELLQLFERQQQEQIMREEAAMRAEHDARNRRPEKHYLTIANNGTLLEATQTVTGFQPEALLLTSIYDSLYDDDLPGFLAVKTQFWDKEQLEVEVFIRRRSIDGDWIWLISKAVMFIDSTEIKGIVLEERLAPDESIAKEMNRITRLAAILIQAAEAAFLKDLKTSSNDSESAMHVEPQSDHMSLLNDDVLAYQTLAARMAKTGLQIPEHAQDLEAFIRIVEEGSSYSNGNEGGLTAFEQEALINIAGIQKKTFDPQSVIEAVRKGVCLDLGLTMLLPEEVKLITLVLTGNLAVDRVAPLIYHALQRGAGIGWMMSNFSLEREKTVTRHSHKSSRGTRIRQQPAPPRPPISVINLSYTYIGNVGAEKLASVLYQGSSQLTTIDISFCNIDEKGFSSLARALTRRKRENVKPLKGVILSGNYISRRAAQEIGTALSPTDMDSKKRSRRRRQRGRVNGYETDGADSDDDDDEDFFAASKGRNKNKQTTYSTGTVEQEESVKENGLQVLHVASSSMNEEAVSALLEGLGASCTIQELNLSSNNFGSAGAKALVTVLESRSRGSSQRNIVVMPYLDRLDMSNNNLGDDGTTQVTRAIAKRTSVHLVDLKLSSNGIGSVGIETIMNKLLHHSIICLSLDKNTIGDQGCQLVAASLPSMKSISRLNLGFNQIGSHGITSLMRGLVACESITYLGLSGNVLRISGAISLGFALLQHPRLEELDLDNCCLGQAAQCHIVTGILANRWVPMKRLRGYDLGPPMAAIGAIDPRMANLSNEDCLRIRKDEQMKTMLTWMEENRQMRQQGASLAHGFPTIPFDAQNTRFLTPDYIASLTDVHGTPSQSAYFRLLGWLINIPFDEDELSSLQDFFYDTGGGEGEREREGHINLKLRGDLLAALEGEGTDDAREEFPMLGKIPKGSVGIDLDKLYVSDWSSWDAFRGHVADDIPTLEGESDEDQNDHQHMSTSNEHSESESSPSPSFGNHHDSSALSGMDRTESGLSGSTYDRRRFKRKARITMFPLFEQQLADLKEAATEMIEQEEDPMQHEIILTQYAQASLTILRQLRYHCMNSGLDGWRQGGLKRKVLIVDDSHITRKLVSKAFENANFIVDTAENGEEGVQKLKASLYDIAFMDIDMPVMNGFEATKKLREWEDATRPGARQPICALTATYVDDFERSELMRFKEAGLDVMESKPCNISRLFKVVDDVSPMFSDLNITVMQRERSEHSFHSNSST